jgi:1-acyl-sn-glycerol-3-phosphate acyltransferase
VKASRPCWTATAPRIGNFSIFSGSENCRNEAGMLMKTKDRDLRTARKAGMFWMTRMVNGSFIDRYNADVGALRQTLRRLQEGGILAMTPEGTRSQSGNLIEAKPGGIFLAWKAGVPILPAAITGTEDAVVREHFKHFKRLDIKAVAGMPFRLPSAQGQDRDEVMQEYTDEVMCRIAMLLPPERRGVYAHHPRLKQLLSIEAKAP